MQKELFELFMNGVHTMTSSCVHDFMNNNKIDNPEQITSALWRQLRDYVKEKTKAANNSIRDIQEADNILAIYGYAFLKLQEEQPSDKKIDCDWAARFNDYACSSSDKDMQEFWSSILACEFKKPGSIFKRTLFVVHQVEKFELEWFFEVTKYVFDKSCFPSFIMEGNEMYKFNELQTLIDCGLVNSNEGSISFTEKPTLHFSSVLMEIELTNPSFGIQVYTLTDAGSQLCNIREDDTSQSFLEKFKKRIENNGSVKEVKITPTK